MIRGVRRVCGVLVLGLSAIAFVPAPASAATAAPCPDPTILIDHARARPVTLFCTGYGFPARSASSIAGLSDATPHPAFAASGWPRWASGQFWAPDLEKVGQRYVLYYSARLDGNWRHCIGVAVSNRPDGGFRDLGVPLVGPGADGTIDPALLAAGGKLFLFYKLDGNAVGAQTALYGRQLSADGLRLLGPPVVLLRSDRGGWEHGVIEGPAPIQLGATTYLLYSGGFFYTAGYAEGEALRTGDPLGAYHRVSSSPLLHGNGRWVGTGGGSIVIDGGRMLLAYAAFRAGERVPQRLLFVRPLQLNAGILRLAGPARGIPLRGG